MLLELTFIASNGFNHMFFIACAYLYLLYNGGDNETNAAAQAFTLFPFTDCQCIISPVYLVCV